MKECFCYFPNCLVEWACDREELNKIACKILRLQKQAQLWNSRLAATQMSTQLNEIDYLIKKRQKLYLFPKQKFG